jgi:sugar phosphate isomerase/epimerase
MNFRHAEHAERTVKLAYCLNLHPSNDLAETLAGMTSITLPLRERLSAGKSFGVGMYLSAPFARSLVAGRNEHDLIALGHFLSANGLDPFTFNAFPHSRFHEDGLKQRVFEPTWREDERLTFTNHVAHAAARLARDTKRVEKGAHVSISTHSGMFGAHVRSPVDLDECAAGLARAVDELAHIEEDSGVHIVLALEPEPRASAENSAQLAAFLARVREIGAAVLEDERNRDRDRARALLRAHLGHCLDGCHAAVEGDLAPLATLEAFALGKFQYSNALVVDAPATNTAGVEALLALDEPRYLHQVTGHGTTPMRASDLPELRAALQAEARTAWLACDRLVCHFHVPVDLERVEGGLTTTRAFADRLLQTALEDPASWTTRDLHLEIETYTWDILPGRARGAGELVDGLEREYRHVIGLLQRAGWRHAD